MNIKDQLHKVRHGSRYRIGGSSDSNTQQTSQNYDQRQVVTNTASSYDLSNNSKTNADNTSNLYDASSKTTITNNLDGGAIAGALNMGNLAINGALNMAQSALTAGTEQAVHAYDYADNIFAGALDAVNQNDARAFNAFDRASQIQEGAIGQLQSAYADAKGTSASQQKIMLAVLAVAGVFALSAMKKGI
jgi:hypothetical protein